MDFKEYQVGLFRKFIIQLTQAVPPGLYHHIFYIQTTQKKRKLSTSSSQKKRKTISSFSVYEDVVSEENRTSRTKYVDRSINTDETCIEVNQRISADDLVTGKHCNEYVCFLYGISTTIQLATLLRYHQGVHSTSVISYTCK